VQISPPYLMFLGDVPDQLAAKTAHGIVDWRREWCLGQLRLPGCGADLGLPEIGIDEAARQGAKTLIVGVANAGGFLPEHWTAVIVQAIEAGLDVASGLHVRLGSKPEIAQAAQRHGRRLFDVRHSDQSFATGKGRKRSGLRLLTVGTDCSVGKKYTVLALEREMRARGFDAEFKATGQTGVFISGRGVAIDAVVADFISGAVEWLSPDADAGHWDLVEGQGSLFHPSFAGVSLGPTRTTMRGVQQPLPSIADVIDLTIRCGRLTNPSIRPVGIAVNTQALGEDEAKAYLDGLGGEHALPATDPVRFGVGAIVELIDETFPRAR
jgi:uncharacterized NAD-dependent epimerase/dehydratase family protein